MHRRCTLLLSFTCLAAVLLMPADRLRAASGTAASLPEAPARTCVARATWDDDSLPLVEDELEIFGRNVGEQVTLIFSDGFETGDTSAWSSSTR